MTVNEPIFTKVALSQLFVKNYYTEFHEHPTNSLVADINGPTDTVSMDLSRKGLNI